jgi:hypothetical protein
VSDVEMVVAASVAPICGVIATDVQPARLDAVP